MRHMMRFLMAPLICCVVAAAFLSGCSQSNPNPEDVVVGAQSPDFSLTAIDGTTLKSRSLKGNVVIDRKSTRLNSSHITISYAVFCLKKKKTKKKNKKE